MFSYSLTLLDEQRRKWDKSHHHDAGNDHRQAAHGTLQFACFQ